MNYVILIGNVVADPDIRYVQGDIACCTFRIAVQRQYSRETDFFQCVAWRRTGETIHQYFRRGHKIAIVGSIQTRSYEVDDQKRYVTEMIVDEFEFVQPRGADDGRGDAPPTSRQPYIPPTDVVQTRLDTSGFVPVDDDGLPF